MWLNCCPTLHSQALRRLDDTIAALGGGRPGGDSDDEDFGGFGFGDEESSDDDDSDSDDDDSDSSVVNYAGEDD